MSDWVDNWARQVAHRITRRQLLGGVGAVAAGTALGSLGPGAVAVGSVTADGITVSPASARKLTCPGGYVPCGSICCDPDGTCIATGSGFVCSNACGGNAHFQKCNGVCQDVYYDPDNCGYCGHVCPPPPPSSAGKATGSAVCNAGQCGCSCDNGLRECTDAKGRCVCVSGPCKCSAANCKPPTQCCANVCTDVLADPANCGTCGHACPGCPPSFTAVCTNGTCSCQCLPPLTLCGSTCTDTSNDVNNCGGCGKVCSSHCSPPPGFVTICEGGQCANFEEIIQFC
jgi:hypothetical protein